MAEILIPHWVQTRWRLSGYGQKWQFGMNYYTGDDVTSNTQLDDFCNILWDLNINKLQPLLNVGHRIDEFSAETHYPQSAQYEGSYSPASPVFGSDSSTACALHTALSVRLTTGRRGRRFNGRFYLGGMTEVDAGAIDFTSGFLIGVADFVSTFLATIIVDDLAYQPAVASREGGFLTLLAGAVLESYIDSQRRRLAGRGD